MAFICNFAAINTISMRKSLIVAAFLLFVLKLDARQDQHVSRPKLVVGIVVDQMRWDYLYRYYDRYSEDGFKRMMNEGYSCQNAFINYLPSFTAPGHSCIYTGSVPSIHGIVANDWMDNKTGKGIYCTEDKTVTAVAGSYKAGQMSPRNMLTSTITDELRLATNMRSKVYGISIKDRGAILPAGHLANGAFWFDDSTGNFMSSSYYGNNLPDWMTKFNNKRWADSFLNSTWVTLYDKSSYVQSLPDNNTFEGPIKGENKVTFPHSVAAAQTNYNRLRYLPAANTMLVKAAKACIHGTQLGQGSETDFLCISFSSTDYVGHTFTPNSVEAEDMFLRLDEEIASLLKYLDRHVGAGNYTIFLTADHGAAHNAEYMQSIKLPAGNRAEGDAFTSLNKWLKEKTGKDSLVRDLSNYQVYLNDRSIDKYKMDREAVKHLTTEWFEQQDGVAYIIDLEHMSNSTAPANICKMAMNGYNRLRSGCLQVILQPGWYSGYGPTGTTHGTWNPYDTHIPLLWYGWGIRQGENFKKVNMTDIAATLAAMLHIQMPNGCIGKPIKELMKK